MKKNNLIFLTGSSGLIGNAIQNLTIDLSLNCYPISASNIFENVSDFNNFDPLNLFNFLSNDLDKLSKNFKTANIIFAHRIRCKEPLKALIGEFIVSRELVIYLNKYFKNLNVIYVGSITGELVHKDSPESYHYTKDMQKSICRYLTITYPKIKANVLVLSAFRKYSIENSDISYTEICSRYKDILGGISLANLDNIAYDILKFTTEINHIRGAIIPLDSGYSIIQH
jgi:hypothetical protein